MPADITCVFSALSNHGAIYISNITSAANLPLLRGNSIPYLGLSIGAVVSITKSKRVNYIGQNIDHLFIEARDCETQTIKQHFGKTYDFIDNNRKNTNILVHCHAGISRSPTIVIAYLMKKYRYSLYETSLIVKRKRNEICPNSAFLSQLQEYALELGLKNQNKSLSILKNKSSFERQANHVACGEISRVTCERERSQRNGVIEGEQKCRLMKKIAKIKQTISYKEMYLNQRNLCYLKK